MSSAPPTSATLNRDLKTLGSLRSYPAFVAGGSFVNALTRLATVVITARAAGALGVGIYGLAAALTTPAFAMCRRGAPLDGTNGLPADEDTFGWRSYLSTAAPPVLGFFAISVTAAGFIADGSVLLTVVAVAAVSMVEVVAETIHGAALVVYSRRVKASTAFGRALTVVAVYALALQRSHSVAEGARAMAEGSAAFFILADVPIAVWASSRAGARTRGSRKASPRRSLITGVAREVSGSMVRGVPSLAMSIALNTPAYVIQVLLGVVSLGTFTCVRCIVDCGTAAFTAIPRSTLPSLRKHLASGMSESARRSRRLLLVAAASVGAGGIVWAWFAGQRTLELLYHSVAIGRSLILAMMTATALGYLATVAWFVNAGAARMGRGWFVALGGAILSAVSSTAFCAQYGLIGGALALAALYSWVIIVSRFAMPTTASDHAKYTLPAAQALPWQVSGDRFIKRYRTGFHGEVRKATALADAFRGTPHRAPAVLRSTDSDCTIEFEYIPDLRTSGDVLVGACRRLEEVDGALRVFAGVGDALAAIHAMLPLGDDTWAAPPAADRVLREELGERYADLLASSGAATLHGDFGFSNVLVSREGQVVIIDASPNAYLTTSTTAVGPVLLDIGHFISCTFGLLPIASHAELKRDIMVRARDAFLRAYEARRGITLDRVLVERTAIAILQCYLSKRLGSQIAGKAASRMLAARYSTRLTPLDFGPSPQRYT